MFKWTVSEDRKILRLNGADFYQGDGGLLTGHDFPTSQVQSDVTINAIQNDFDKIATSPRPLGYNAGFGTVPAADGTSEELINLTFSVTRLDQEKVHGADGLELRILKDSKDRLAISDIVTVPFDNSKAPQEDDQPPAPPTEHKEAEKPEEKDRTFNILPVNPAANPAPNGAAPVCEGHSEAYCHFIEIFKARVAKIHDAIQAAKASRFSKVNGSARHPCHGKMRRPGAGHHHRGHFGLRIKHGVHRIRLWIIRITRTHPQPEVAPEHATGFKAPAQPDHPHIQHGPVHGFHRVSHVMHNVFFGFFVPVLIGIAAGMTASLLGMVVGTCIAMLWFKIRRGGRRGNASGRTTEGAKGEVALGEEKMGLMQADRDSVEYEEAPPMYADKE